MFVSMYIECLKGKKKTFLMFKRLIKQMHFLKNTHICTILIRSKYFLLSLKINYIFFQT